MKYQITEFRYPGGGSYYTAQYVEDGVWKTIDEFDSVYSRSRVTQEFPSARAAKRALERLAREKKNKEYSSVIDTGEIEC